VASACAKHNIAWGMPAPDADAVVRPRDQGAQLIAYGGDFGFMMQGLSRCGDELAAAFGE
ncbi:MAG TPA: 4-hydroxy-2-oxovalerate aldolase, partial [Planctomycetaceae bacterium]|nr:4-hydroxy-2-oxovalerate aldolase [Planctomycetaceae bacterium]